MSFYIWLIPKSSKWLEASGWLNARLVAAIDDFCCVVSMPFFRVILASTSWTIWNKTIFHITHKIVHYIEVRTCAKRFLVEKSVEVQAPFIHQQSWGFVTSIGTSFGCQYLFSVPDEGKVRPLQAQKGLGGATFFCQLVMLVGYGWLPTSLISINHLLYPTCVYIYIHYVTLCCKTCNELCTCASYLII